MDREAVLRLFDAQMRRDVVPADPSVRVERDALTTRLLVDGDEPWSAVLWSSLDEANADAAIARAAALLRPYGDAGEWKLYAHDRPADLARRLAAAGFAPGDEEAVVVAEIAELDLDATAPPGVEVRVADDAESVAAYAAVHERVFGGGRSTHEAALLRAVAADPPPALAVVCVAGAQPVAAARIEFDRGSDFASLWGGATVAEWRGRGLYRATVALRGRLARDRGYRFLQVDALPTSRPILERLGFVQLTTTTPFAPAA